MGIRTDLALEAHELCKKEARGVSEIDGVSTSVEEYDGITLTRVNITNENGMKRLNKAIGRYVTIEAPMLKYSDEEYVMVCNIISDEIRAMKEERNGITLILGLGNDKITPDALGTRVVDNLMITNHIKKLRKDILPENISNVCAVVPGVMGTTGIETVEIIKGISDKLKPDLIIAVDAMVAADIERVSTTIQIADTGIEPGAGVGNNREGINEKVMGVKVIAIGVPTVIDAETISKTPIPKEMAPLMVTTCDIDLVIEKMAKTVANGINLALHDITLEEVNNYVG